MKKKKTILLNDLNEELETIQQKRFLSKDRKKILEKLNIIYVDDVMCISYNEYLKLYTIYIKGVYINENECKYCINSGCDKNSEDDYSVFCIPKSEIEFSDKFNEMLDENQFVEI